MTEPVSPPAAHGSSPSTALAARESLGACARHTSGQLAPPAPVLGTYTGLYALCGCFSCLCCLCNKLRIDITVHQ